MPWGQLSLCTTTTEVVGQISLCTTAIKDIHLKPRLFDKRNYFTEKPIHYNEDPVQPNN